jgi:C-terminal processing protease CtpA/Prc
LGGLATDLFFSGTFEAGGKRIGFLRIPSFLPTNINLAINQFAGEIIFFQQNTDGLIIDDMRNPGGSVSYCEFLLTLLMPNTFRTLGFEIRATASWVQFMAVGGVASHAGRFA